MSVFPPTGINGSSCFYVVSIYFSYILIFYLAPQLLRCFLTFYGLFSNKLTDLKSWQIQKYRIIFLVKCDAEIILSKQK